MRVYEAPATSLSDLTIDFLLIGSCPTCYKDGWSQLLVLHRGEVSAHTVCGTELECRKCGEPGHPCYCYDFLALTGCSAGANTHGVRGWVVGYEEDLPLPA